MKLTGKQTWTFSKELYIASTGTAVGPEEAAGPLGETYDLTFKELHCGQDNWELAERHLLEQSINICLQKAEKQPEDVDLFLSGDLINQTVIANYTARQNKIPFLGMFGACSTSMETLALGAALIDGGFANHVLTAVSSHNATAERQFRYPTEYGGQKPDTATYTVTGAGASLVGTEPSPIKITSATIGRVMDLGISDPFDMGSAMAPAAADTIATHFNDTGRTPTDYDLIITGDLSSVGTPILKQLLQEKKFDISSNHQDCGLLVYRPDQPVFAGGSGCACSAVVTYGHLLEELRNGKLKKILVVATGALMNPMMIQQKETIPTIAHGVVLEASSKGGHE
ncbi:stage V sporulation protein AD [Pseudalkalibacillus decolorationis]|uniref:stage V sporulation protein AD n=1 Tax=Pseudalkalibacillus decolorationis TaxID=163879 RepID=UPI002147403A|nr:stage V sporulation protein AD [Pseudalkalibacillus decolorationis]